MTQLSRTLSWFEVIILGIGVVVVVMVEIVRAVVAAREAVKAALGVKADWEVGEVLGWLEGRGRADLKAGPMGEDLPGVAVGVSALHDQFRS
jgi:hypothetical protein